ncbi:MAG: DUF4381 domain-containing protein [Pseudohongiellaceae bacterium]
MDNEELLAQLRDIHLPESIGLWPLAPGWWLLILTLLALTGIGLHYGLRALHRYRLRQQALAELARIQAEYAYASGDPNVLKLRYVNQVNTLLRRVALFHFPASAVGSLSGVAWVDFIRKKGDPALLNKELADVLSFGRFQTRCEVDTEALDNLAQDWINSLYRRSSANA